MKDSYDNLRKLVEKTAGRRMKTPRDFEMLAEQIWNRTHENVSATTLKRFFGYLDEAVAPRKITLDLLARYVGCCDFDTFSEMTGTGQSHILHSQRISSDQIAVGKRLRLTWIPDRTVTIRHLGGGRFMVEESINSKLAAGDTFTCHLLIMHEPLFLDGLTHRGERYPGYVAGRDCGIVYEELPD